MKLIDVGSMGGTPRKFKGFEVVSIEPDTRDSTDALNYVLYNKSEDLIFNITKGIGNSSILEPNLELLKRYGDISRFWIEERKKIPAERVKTLDSIIDKADFIKLDTQGSELYILQGAERLLKTVFGVQVEVEFIEAYKNQPLFRDVDKFMSRDFELVGLTLGYLKRKCPFKSRGGLVWGDALYFKKPHLVKDLKNAIKICLLFGMKDYAYALWERGGSGLALKDLKVPFKRRLNIGICNFIQKIMGG